MDLSCQLVPIRIGSESTNLLRGDYARSALPLCKSGVTHTVSAANNAASMKRSGYLRHKMAFVQEERRQRTVDFRKLAGDHNPADSFTKYTAFAKWKLHMEFVRNSKITKVE